MWLSTKLVSYEIYLLSSGFLNVSQAELPFLSLPLLGGPRFKLKRVYLTNLLSKDLIHTLLSFKQLHLVELISDYYGLKGLAAAS